MKKDLEAGVRPEEIEVKPMQYDEIPVVVHNGVEANKPDPLFRYILHDVPDKSKSLFMQRRYDLYYTLGFSETVRQGCAWTVNHGESFIILELAPKDAAKRTRWSRFLTTLNGKLSNYLRSLDSPEQRKRQAEVREKMATALKAGLGDAIENMRTLEGFATAPHKQGRGYGTALAKHVLDIADREGKAVWLASSNVANTPFYESLEFVTVAEFTLGESNSTWKDEPVIIRIMVRGVSGTVPEKTRYETA